MVVYVKEEMFVYTLVVFIKISLTVAAIEMVKKKKKTSSLDDSGFPNV